jgi:hypothetical protein
MVAIDPARDALDKRSWRRKRWSTEDAENSQGWVVGMTLERPRESVPLRLDQQELLIFSLDDVLQRRSLDHLPEIFTVED